MKKLSGLFLAAFLLSGCVSTSSTMVGGHTVPATVTLQPEQIVIYRSAELVGRPYREVAILSSRGDSIMTDMAQFHRSMQERASRIGANAVILGETREPSTAAEIAGAVLGVPANRRSEAIAIYVEGLEPPPPAPRRRQR